MKIFFCKWPRDKNSRNERAESLRQVSVADCRRLDLDHGRGSPLTIGLTRLRPPLTPERHPADESLMDHAVLDQLFPKVVFVYGAVMTFVLHFEPLQRMAEARVPGPILAQMQAHRILALVCLVVGALWILQNLWLGAAPL